MGYGKFEIEDRMIWDYPFKVMRIMAKMIVYEVHHNLGNRSIVYYAQSPLFDTTDVPHFNDESEYYLAVNEIGDVVCQKSPFSFLEDFTPARCEFTGRTDNLFAFHFDGELRRPLYRVKEWIDGEDRTKKYHDIFTGVQVKLGE